MSVVLDRKLTTAEADAAHSMPRCSCLPFCFWRSSSRSRPRGAEAAPGKEHPRRRGFKRLIRLSWLALSSPWLRTKKGGRKQDAGKKRRVKRLLLLLKTSLQANKALASVVVSGDRSGLLPATVSSFADAKKQNRSNKPRTTSDGVAPSGTTSRPQTSRTNRGTSSRSTVPARTGTSQPFTTTLTGGEPATAADRIWRAPSRRHTLQQPVYFERPAGLWTAATTLGVIVLFGRVTAMVFLCSCLYGMRFVRSWAAGASAKSSVVVASASSSRRFCDPIGVASEKVADSCVTEECKKKVVMSGLLERTGKRSSSRFGR